MAWGGRIEFDGFADYRVYDKDGYGAGLNLTRSLGDLNAHCDCGLIADPELGEYVAAKLQVAACGPSCLACSLSSMRRLLQKIKSSCFAVMESGSS